MTYLRELSGWMIYTFSLVVLTNMSADLMLTGNPLLGLHLALMSFAVFFLALSHLDKSVTPLWIQLVVKGLFWLTISASAALAGFTLHLTGVF